MSEHVPPGEVPLDGQPGLSSEELKSLLDSGRTHYAAYLPGRHPRFSPQRIDRIVESGMHMPGVRATIIALERFDKVSIAMDEQLGPGTAPRWFALENLFPWDRPVGRR